METKESAQAAEEVQEEQEQSGSEEAATEEVEQGEKKEDEVVQEEQPKKKTAQERIDEITKKRRDAEREAEYWRKIALERTEREEVKETPAAEPDTDPRPKLGQFDSTEAYEDALLVWHDKRKEKREQSKRQQDEQEEALRKFNKSAAKMREQYEDFDEVIESPVFSNDMRVILLNSDNGASVAYHLGKPENHDLANKIRSLPPNMQIYELGKLETQILLAQKTKKVTGMPNPIKPVGDTGGTPEVDDSKLSDDEWYKKEKERARKRIEDKLKGG